MWSVFLIRLYLFSKGERGCKYPSVTERLYCRSINKNELNELSGCLEEIRIEFAQIITESVDLTSFGLDEESTGLPLDGRTLADVFARFFDVILEAIECSNVFYNEFNEYIPLRVGFTDAPDYIFDINRPDDLYESVASDELPFWLR